MGINDRHKTTFGKSGRNMGGKTVSNFTIPEVEVEHEEFDFSDIDQKTVQLSSTLRQNRVLMVKMAELEQEVKELQKEKLRSFAKFVFPVPLPRGKNVYKRKVHRRPTFLQDDFSWKGCFSRLLTEVPNLVYGIVHECR